ncbi:MAG: hypothetical protein QOE29_142 [Gaiellaceae bacterium]|nr:hypothetical protein [Gaiellaceae bacterium]
MAEPAPMTLPRLRSAEARLGLERLVAWLQVHALLLCATAAYLVLSAWFIPHAVQSDTWLALVAGREVAQHGIPAHDALTIWGHGHGWIDQQWLAQLGFYRLFALGGFPLVALAHLVALGATLSMAVVAAVRLGGSRRAVLWLELVIVLPLVIWGAAHMRTQSFAYPLFVVVLWLLAADARSPSRRVFLVLPLLALWGNLHGTVVLGVALTVVRAATLAWEGRRGRRPRLGRPGALTAGAALCLFASPYGLQLVGYYHELLLNPAFARYVREWEPTHLTAITVPFFLLAGLTCWLVGRSGSRLTLFDRLVLLLLFAAGLSALRSVIWFLLAVLILVPRLLDEVIPAERRPVRSPVVNATLGAVAVAALGWALILPLVQPASWFVEDFPRGGADALVAAAARAPGAPIFATEAYSDWLLWEHPPLAGRVAFDARFELLSVRELRLAAGFGRDRAGAAAAVRGFRLVVFDPHGHQFAVRMLLAEPGSRLLYRSSQLVVIERAQSRS